MKNNWIAMSNKRKIPLDVPVLLLDDDGNLNVGKLLPKTSFHRVHAYSLRAVEDEFVFELITYSEDGCYGIVHNFALISDFKYWQEIKLPQE